MHFAEVSAIPGVFEINVEAHQDKRGFFARLFCPQEFAKAGISFTSCQINLSHNIDKFTLRGMHFQQPPFMEAKLVRVIRGRVYDVVLDLRPQSPSYKKWWATELSAQKANALFIPQGCAHGFLTLEPETDMLYQMGSMYVPGQACGVRYNDPAFNIQWPHKPAILSEQDQNWPLFADKSR